MKAAIYDLLGKLKIREKHVPEINEHEILIKQKAAGLSTSDILAYKHNNVTKLYHKNTGVITKIGSEVQGYNVGDSIYYDTFINCGECQPCARSRGPTPNLCFNLKDVWVYKERE